MMTTRAVAVMAFSLLTCKGPSDDERKPAVATARPSPSHGSAMPSPVAPVEPTPTWYRASVRGKNGVEAAFFLGVPAAGVAGDAVIKVGRHEMRFPATFDGKTLTVPMPVQQTTIQASVGRDGALAGTLSGTWRVVGNWSQPLVGTKVAAPTVSALATLAGDAPVLDLGEPRTLWRLKLKESGVGKLEITQLAPGDFEALILLDTGNVISVAGNGRGHALVLTGTDGFSSYRLELALDDKHAQAHGVGGFVADTDRSETLTAARGPDFVVTTKPRAKMRTAKISLPELPELKSLPPGPLVVELGGSWCPKCRLAVPVLRDLYKQYQAKGLHMVTLLYELTDDPKQDAEQGAKFKANYEIPWSVIPVPGGVDQFAAIIPAGITDIDPSGFPMILFIDSDRSLVAIHAGFPPTESDEYRRVTAELRANVDKLFERQTR